MSVDIENLKRRFKDRFGQDAVWGARAPGRVNLIGEHIDYNGGLVAPAAIDRKVAMLAAPARGGRYRLYSITFDEEFSWEARVPSTHPVSDGWPNYFLGVLDELHRRGLEPGPFDVVVDGDIPIGGGLSSSAAFEVCAAHLLLASLGATLPNKEIALLSQAAENGPWVGMRCGIMDQYASACAVEGHVLLLDCQNLEAEAVPLDSAKVSILIVHSTVPRELVKSGYNERRTECEEGLQLLNRRLGRNEEFLLGYSPQEIAPIWDELREVVRKRVRHVFSEQERVARFREYLISGDFAGAGDLMRISHTSLRDDYEVSCRELDVLTDLANEIEGVFGCRMTGGGFGGCAVALVQPDRAEEIGRILAERFEKRVGRRPWSLVTQAAGGARGWVLR